MKCIQHVCEALSTHSVSAVNNYGAKTSDVFTFFSVSYKLQTKSGTPRIYSSSPLVMDWHLYSAFLNLLIDIDLAIQSYSVLF